MSPRTKKQLAILKDARRNQIMNVALTLFAKEGFHATSINNIAKKAGIAKGLVYTYFSSKDDLLKQIYISGLNEIVVYFDPNRDGILTNEEMIYFIEKIFDTIKKNTNYWRLYFSLILQPSVQSLVGKYNISELSKSLHGKLTVYLKKMNYKNPEEEAILFHCLFDGIFINYIMDKKSIPLDNLKQLLLKRYTK